MFNRGVHQRRANHNREKLSFGRTTQYRARRCLQPKRALEREVEIQVPSVAQRHLVLWLVKAERFPNVQSVLLQWPLLVEIDSTIENGAVEAFEAPRQLVRFYTNSLESKVATPVKTKMQVIPSSLAPLRYLSSVHTFP